ncbi:YagK/YfjJ domain-containing protein [Halomonas sp. BC04]|uniref:YagK/YfjJ domain-containing protein n=1 Tax=Halomonas sp. BC04 TaxID=1403540 RepID=UPI0003ED7D69|nr:inovirus-type Gp2 protein [Halomonas sp. BC04]EWH02096.1 hypothetical protein Q427_10610 [Halomonas sp. BC04]
MLFSPTVGNRPRKRLPERPDLLLHWAPHYRDLLVQTQRGPLIANYLETLYQVMEWARQSNSRVLALRVDLRYPVEMPVASHHATNLDLMNFLFYLSEELDHAGTTNPHDMRYVWCREQHLSDKPHYHLLLLLNGDAYKFLGKRKKEPAEFKGCDIDIPPTEGAQKDNLYQRIERSWGRAIGWPKMKMKRLVHEAENKWTKKPYRYHFKRDDLATFAEAFYGASYLCKVHSKPFAQRIHCFDHSRS